MYGTTQFFVLSPKNVRGLYSFLTVKILNAETVKDC